MICLRSAGYNIFALLVTTSPLNMSDSEYRKAFDKYDKDGSGYVSVAELKDLIRDLHHGIKDDILEMVLKVSEIRFQETNTFYHRTCNLR